MQQCCCTIFCPMYLFVDIEWLCTLVVLCGAFAVITSAVSFPGWCHDHDNLLTHYPIVWLCPHNHHLPYCTFSPFSFALVHPFVLTDWWSHFPVTHLWLANKFPFLFLVMLTSPTQFLSPFMFIVSYLVCSLTELGLNISQASHPSTHSISILP